MAKEKKKEPIPTGRKGEYIDPATGKRFSSVTGEIPKDISDRPAGGGSLIIEQDGHTFIAPPSEARKVAELRAEGKLPTLEEKRLGREKLTPGEFEERVEIAGEALPPTQLERQFEAEGGFQEQEGRLERAAEFGAEIGLAIPTFLGNKLTAGIEKLTGQKFGRQSAAELAETPQGKALGLSTAAVGAALAATAAFSLGSAALKLASAKIAVGTGIKAGTISKIVGFGAPAIGTLLVGLSAEDMVDVILDREKIESIKGGMSEIGEIGSDVAGLYAGTDTGTRARGVAEIEQQIEGLLIMEAKAQQAAELDKRVQTSGDYIDFVADISNKRAALIDSANTIISAEGTPITPEERIIIIDRLRERMEEDRNELIERGVLKDVLE